MLLLTRRIDESVYLTDKRTGQSLGQVKIISVVTRKAVDANAVVDTANVRIGFEFPEHISIVRDNAKPLQENDDG